ncbi:MAG TPA: M48 family metalloprotease [Vicinamibacterales bacterium]|nr:M48 family metalloprotease [Vicinamibacterales bacterium]
MKTVLIAIATLIVGSPAYAQLGGIMRKAQQAQERKQQFDDMNITEDEEIKLGADVSEKIRQRFGVVQDAAVHKYVTLVGTVLTEQTTRPKLPWTFIVLDTDGVNAFAAPGGFVHITRGALGLIKSEAELAGVLGHEIAHVAEKHTVDAIRKGKGVQLGTGETLSNRGLFLDALANRTYSMVLENSFDRGDELEADKTGILLVQKATYAGTGLAEFLTRLSERNKDQPQKNGLFASHPETQERIGKVKQLAGAKPGAVVAARYASTIKYPPTEITKIAVVLEGSAGLAGSEKEKAKPEAKKEEEKKSRFGLGSLTKSVTAGKNEQQVAASGGARGVGADRLAKGGDNPNLVKTSIAPSDLAAFKKGIA